MTEPRLRVVLAEDHEVVRHGLVLLLSAEADFDLVADVASGPAAVEATRFHHPDVVVMDATMPGLDGISATLQAKALSPDTKVVVLTGSESIATFEAALAAGVDGYVPKTVPPAELVAAVRAVARGERFFHAPPRQPRAVQPVPARTPAPDLGLTPRELDVLRLMATSHTYREMADQLIVGEETVRSYAKNILHKLGQPDRTQAVVAAVKAGLLQLS